MPPRIIHRPSSCEMLPFVPAHLDAAVKLSLQAGWPYRLEDWRMALTLGLGVVAVENGADVVGTVQVTPFGPDTAAINMVIVDESRRGRGLGRQLMAAALRIGVARNLRLITAQDGFSRYRQLGFSEDGKILQHQGQTLPWPRRRAL